MTDLSQLQTKLQSFLLNDDTAIQDEIVETDNFSSTERLNIYYQAYRLRLIDALANNYPALYTYLGEEAFNRMAVDYLTLHPSHFRSIRWFGHELPDFLKLQQYDLHFVELAYFEWMMSLAFDAGDAALCSPEMIASIPPECWPSMRFQPHASLNMLNISTNAMAIWHAVTYSQSIPDPIREVETHWLIWRKEMTVQFCSLPEDEAYAMLAMTEGKSFDEICIILCEWISEDDAPLKAASLLKSWLIAGLITSVSYEN